MLLRRDDGRFLLHAAQGKAMLGAVQRIDEGRYRVSCDSYGTFSVDMPTVDAAAQAACVFVTVQVALADAISWGSWPDGRRTRPRTDGERYFRDISDESRRAARALVAELRSVSDWTDEEPGHRAIRTVSLETRKGPRTAFRVEVGEDSLLLVAHAGTLDRAVAFLMLYTVLQRDLRDVLGWEPL